MKSVLLCLFAVAAVAFAVAHPLKDGNVKTPSTVLPCGDNLGNCGPPKIKHVFAAFKVSPDSQNRNSKNSPLSPFDISCHPGNHACEEAKAHLAGRKSTAQPTPATHKVPLKDYN